MKKLLLFLFLIPVLLFGQGGGSHGYVYKIPQFADTYNRLAQFDTNGYIKPITNGVGYVYGNNGVFTFEAATSSNVTGIEFTGTNTITLTLTQISGGTLTASFAVSATGLPDGAQEGDILYYTGGTATWANLCELVTACVGDLYTKVATLETTVSEVVTYLVKKDSVSMPPINYGYLYNFYAAKDTRNIAANGWHVPLYSEYQTLFTYLGGTSIAGGKLKETGFTYWDSPNTGATNEVGFNARGSVSRSVFGIFASQLNANCNLWHFSTSPPTFANHITISFDQESVSNFGVASGKGASIRLIKDSTTLSHGQTGTMTGTDGKVYRTICIGTQEWMADNLAETLYRDGSVIPEVTDDTAWSILTTGARCVYNNDESNR